MGKVFAFFLCKSKRAPKAAAVTEDDALLQRTSAVEGKALAQGSATPGDDASALASPLPTIAPVSGIVAIEIPASSESSASSSAAPSDTTAPASSVSAAGAAGIRAASGDYVDGGVLVAERIGALSTAPGTPTTPRPAVTGSSAPSSEVEVRSVGVQMVV